MVDCGCCHDISILKLGDWHQDVDFPAPVDGGTTLIFLRGDGWAGVLKPQSWAGAVFRAAELCGHQGWGVVDSSAHVPGSGKTFPHLGHLPVPWWPAERVLRWDH